MVKEFKTIKEVKVTRKYLSIFNYKYIESRSIREDYNYEFPLLRRIGNKVSRDIRYNFYTNFSLEGINMKFEKDTKSEYEGIPSNLEGLEFSLENSMDNVTEQMETIVSNIGGYQKPVFINNNTNSKVVSYISKKRPDKIKTCLRELERIINCNFVPGRSSFLTLTYKNTMFNDRLSSKDLTRFIGYLYSWYKINYPNSPKFRYVSIRDLQKNGSIHFHVCLFDVEYLPIEVLQKFWKKQGNVFIEEMKFFVIKTESKESLLNNSSNKVLSDIVLKYNLNKSFTYGKVYDSFIREGLTKDDVDYFLHRFCGVVDVYDMGYYISRYCLKHVKKNDPDRLYYIDRLYIKSVNCIKSKIIRDYFPPKDKEDFDKYLQDKIKEYELQKSTGELVDGKKILSQGVYSIKYNDPTTGEEKMNRVFHRKYITEEDMKDFHNKNNEDGNMIELTSLDEFKDICDELKKSLDKTREKNEKKKQKKILKQLRKK